VAEETVTNTRLTSDAMEVGLGEWSPCSRFAENRWKIRIRIRFRSNDLYFSRRSPARQNAPVFTSIHRFLR